MFMCLCEPIVWLYYYVFSVGFIAFDAINVLWLVTSSWLGIEYCTELPQFKLEYLFSTQKKKKKKNRKQKKKKQRRLPGIFLLKMLHWLCGFWFSLISEVFRCRI